jgi:hypothetical protein
MAQTGFTPIQLYYSSTTTNAPIAANLASGELAINITDGKLFYKDNANAVQVIGWKVVPATAGGTGQTSYAVGDLLYADTTTTLAKLPDVATGNALISGGVTTAPSWGKIGLTTHVSGTLPTANGGTNLTSFTANGVVYASSTSALATGSVLTFNGTTLTAPNLQGPAFSAYKSSNQTVTTNTLTKITFDTEVFDTNSNFASSTFTPTYGGYYQISANVDMNPTSGTLSQASVFLYKNGSNYLSAYNYSTITEVTGVITALVYMNGTTDTLEIYARLTGTTPFVGSGSAVTTFAGVLVRSA